ncbi:VTT domain-containing protein [Candidatus Babeliales bacterium]|nr:VTT domain-containing protein [Candidatus Babeliales bacterium]MBY0353927.1 VTT domain-containing protein [Candidatus Babeliales bacterium]
MKWIKRIYDWMGSKVEHPHANWWLFGLFFIESSFFFIPVDPLLILFCVHNRKRSFFYASVATVASVLGGMFGYLIGSTLWDSIGFKLVSWIISEATFNHVVAQYSLYESWAVFIAGFTPIPYKAVTISAGFCKLPFMPFVGYSILARGARFFLVAGAIRKWGVAIKRFIDDYFNYLVVAFTILLILSCSVFKGAI